LAFLRYPLFSCGVQRNSTRAVAGFLMGGLPLGRLGLSMLNIVPYKISLDKPIPCLYSVRTVNQRTERYQMIATLRNGYRIKTEGKEYTVVGSRKLRGSYFYMVRDANGATGSIRREAVLSGQADGSVKVEG
jgi:hypothetical protein